MRAYSTVTRKIRRPPERAWTLNDNDNDNENDSNKGPEEWCQFV